MSFHDNSEGWTNIAGIVASVVAAYFTFGASTAAEAAIGGAGAAAEAGSAAAGAAGATTAAEAAASSSLAGAAASTSYATYASMAAQALGGVAAVQSSTNQQQAAAYNAAYGKSNAEMAAMQAGSAEEASRRRSGMILGEERAGMAQSGVDPSSGTGLLAYEQSATNAEMDALNIRYQGLLQGRGLLAQSALDTRQAQIYGQNATYAGINAGLSTFGAYEQGKGRYLSRTAVGRGYGGGY